MYKYNYYDLQAMLKCNQRGFSQGIVIHKCLHHIKCKLTAWCTVNLLSIYHVISRHYLCSYRGWAAFLGIDIQIHLSNLRWDRGVVALTCSWSTLNNKKTWQSNPKVTADFPERKYYCFIRYWLNCAYGVKSQEISTFFQMKQFYLFLKSCEFSATFCVSA